MKPKYRYICPCGFRTQKSWRLAAHRHKPKAKAQATPIDPLKDLFPHGQE